MSDPVTRGRRGPRLSGGVAHAMAAGCRCQPSACGLCVRENAPSALTSAHGSTRDCPDNPVLIFRTIGPPTAFVTAHDAESDMCVDRKRACIKQSEPSLVQRRRLRARPLPRRRPSRDRWSIKTKTDADTALDDLKNAVRAGTFDKRGIDPPREVRPQTFREFAQVYKERHVVAKRLALARSIDYCLKPFIEHFGDRPLESIRTADIEDFIADLRKPRIVNRRKGLRTLAPASINRTIELMRHMLNWAVGREYLDRTPFRRGSETLIRKLQEDNRRRRRISEDGEQRLLGVAPPFLRSMIIAALDTGTRQGEMLALRFGDIDWKSQLNVLRGQTTKSRTSPVNRSRQGKRARFATQF